MQMVKLSVKLTASRLMTVADVSRTIVRQLYTDYGMLPISPSSSISLAGYSVTPTRPISKFMIVGKGGGFADIMLLPRPRRFVDATGCGRGHRAHGTKQPQDELLDPVVVAGVCEEATGRRFPFYLTIDIIGNWGAPKTGIIYFANTALWTTRGPRRDRYQ